jgi:hypothetical protein
MTAMPFLLFDVTQTGVSKQYTLVRTVPIAGKAGPLAATQRSKNTKGVTPFPWHAPAAEIVAAIGGAPTQEILIDLKPNATDVHLYRLLDVWGFSYEHWTPLGLVLEALFTGRTHNAPAHFKASFDDHDAERDIVGEFLYVQGGTAGGTWSWGRVGSVNGVLLWRDAFDYLSGEIKKTLHA